MASESNSCVETPAAPEWLSKLENRREKLARSKLGHEIGAGAACDDCGDKCPGLDLHFWRKVCRNCKCRKEKHRCNDDELSGWAQFEILGVSQIRSKPAFIKIKALASQPVQLEWVPPNVAPDVVSDYMEKLGTTQIPVTGSAAAQKRKQQLEFQVPPHDLDAALCDNLTESEANQLLQYVQKIRENCVGLGNVVRIGDLTMGLLERIPLETALVTDNIFKPEYAQAMATLNEIPLTDPILAELLTTEQLAKALTTEVPAIYPKIFVAFSKHTDAEHESIFSDYVKARLYGLNKQAVCSLVHNGPIYDKILTILKDKNLDVSSDPRLGPIADFRKEYLCDPRFKREVDNICVIDNNKAAQYTTPVKSNPALAFHSPLPIKQPLQARFGAQMRQDTPMRKVNFGGVSTIVYDCKLPVNIDYERDRVFAQILKSTPLKHALDQARAGDRAITPVIIATTPLAPDYIDEPTLSPVVKKQLQVMRIDSPTLQSALLNGPFYDRLFETLKEKGIDYKGCKLLTPLEELRGQLLTNRPFYEELREYVTQMSNSLAISYDGPSLHPLQSSLRGSNSNDSGFESKPTTPNTAGYADDMQALSGKFATIPGIEEMNMYPTVDPATNGTLIRGIQGLNVTGGQQPVPSPPAIKCLDCSQLIKFGEVAVKAERAGRDIAWHPECFKCHNCRELLADLVYFFHDGQVYCGRDLAIKLKIPRCKACDELIFTKEYTAAEGSTFHIKHFCCYQCDMPLAGRQYIPDEKSNMPLCLSCYDEYFAAVCQRCHKSIGPDGQGVAWVDVHWHADCFICAGLECGKSLIGGRFCVKENMPFCSPACVRSIIK